MDNELFFKTGTMGRLAQFFAKRQSRGDPYEATLILPAILVILLGRLCELHKINDLAAEVALIAVPFCAGAWMGACLGMPGGPRALMRGISAGAIEGAALAALNDTADRHRLLIDTAALIVVSFAFYWLGHIVVANLRDIALLTEEQWQDGRPRRAWLSSVFWLALRNASLDEVPPRTVVAVQLLRNLSRIAFLLLVLWFLGVPPSHFWRQLLLVFSGHPALPPSP
jgi:hypothetical protein